jgi:hypothetical protein
MSERLFNFTTIFRDWKEYEYTKDSIKDTILETYSSRNNPAKIMVGTEVIDTTLGKVLINLLIMKPYVEKGLKLTTNDLFGFESVTERNLSKYFNDILARFKDERYIDFDDLRNVIGETINEMSDISGKLNILSGNSISFYDFVRLSVEDEEARKIFKPEFDDYIQYDQIENKFNELGDRIEEYFVSRKDLELYPFVKSGTGINKKQFTQAIGFIGLKPDIDGNVIPVVIKDNFLNGLSNLENYFINSKGTRKALITNSKQVRRSGYMTRKLSLATIDRFHNNNFQDCETKHDLFYSVNNADKLYQIKGRHYYDLDVNNKRIILENETEAKLKTVRETDTFLIGKTIGLRSPITCAGHTHVCKTCYGSELSEINRDLNTGLIAVNFLTEPLTQKLLSAKHLLTTNTDKVNWGEKFSDYFAVNMDSIYFADQEVSINIDMSDIHFDEEEEENYVTKFVIYSDGSKVGHYESPESLYISQTLLTKAKSKYFNIETGMLTISAKNLPEGETIFTFIVRNNELSKSLNEMIELIENSNHLDETTYHGLINRFNDLIIHNGMNIDSVHLEMISSNLIRDPKTKTRLDFSKAELDEYEIVRISNVVMDSPLSVSLAFERLDQQFVNLDTYTKDGSSLMDYLYK